jgi:superoxide dismutase, Cu-Zn family
MTMRIWLSELAVALIAVPVAVAQVSVPMALVTEQWVGATIGTVTLMDSPGGLVVTPELTGLPPGGHGFHVHTRGDCGVTLPEGKPVPAGAAGGHFDPQGTGTHLGPTGAGHLGDLPVLEVAADGSATTAVTATRLTVAQARGLALVIHAGGDNYADQPAPLGGGGLRIACGIIPR